MSAATERTRGSGDGHPGEGGLSMCPWLAERSPLKVAAKGRRTGITYAQAFDPTMCASLSADAK